MFLQRQTQPLFAQLIEPRAVQSDYASNPKRGVVFGSERRLLSLPLNSPTRTSTANKINYLSASRRLTVVAGLFCATRPIFHSRDVAEKKELTAWLAGWRRKWALRAKWPGWAPGVGLIVFTFSCLWRPSSQADSQHCENQLKGRQQKNIKVIITGRCWWFVSSVSSSLGSLASLPA